MKGWILKLLMLSALFIFSGCDENTTENGSLTGTVTNSSGDVIVAANIGVVYSDGNQTTSTDEEGKYSFSDLPSSGDVTLKVSKEGYVTSEQTTQLSEESVTLDVVLEEDADVSIRATVSGVITNVAGEPLEGVKVYSSVEEALTNASGEYAIGANVGAKVSITADLENYAQNSQNVTVVENETAELDMTLVVVDEIVSFDVDTGAVITTKGATVELGASSIVNVDGLPYSGNVTAKVSFNQVTSSVGREAFPGDYIGLETNGDETVLQSYGFIDVTLEDENGNALKLADGATATLTYPMDENIVDTPATIPLWYYDTELGTWVEDGVATYDAGTNTYTGTVTHFTTWNLDAKVPRATYKSCVEDINGVRVSAATIHLSTPGWNRSFANNDINGEFGFVNAPSGLAMELRASLDAYASEPRAFTLSAGEDRVDANCMVLDMDASDLFFSVRGKIVYSSGLPVAYQGISIYNDKGQYVGYASTDDNGVFTSGDYLINEAKSISLRFGVNIDGTYINYDKTYALDTSKDVTNIGTIEVKATTVTGCIQREDGTRNFENGYNYLTKGSPFGDELTSIDGSGNFSFALEKDNLARTIFAFADERTLTKSFEVIANQDSIDLGTDCLVLDQAIDMNVSVQAEINTTNPEVYLTVTYERYANYEYPHTYSDERLIDGEGYWDYSGSDGGVYVEGNPVTSGSFDLTKNGVYYIFQKRSEWIDTPLNGTISITLEGTTHTVTIPVDTEANEAWAGFAIEVYQGEITVVELNKEASSGAE